MSTYRTNAINLANGLTIATADGPRTIGSVHYCGDPAGRGIVTACYTDGSAETFRADVPVRVTA